MRKLILILMLLSIAAPSWAAPSRVKTWVDGEKLWAADLNGEFNAIIAGFSPYALTSALSSYMLNTKAAVEAALTGVISSHSHSGLAGWDYVVATGETVLFWGASGAGTDKVTMVMVDEGGVPFLQFDNYGNGTSTGGYYFNGPAASDDIHFVNGQILAVGTGTDASAANLTIDAGTGLISRSTSSRRYKQDIVPLAFDWNKYMSLKPSEFSPKGEPSRRLFGLIAEEVYPLYPQLSSLNKKGEPEDVAYPHVTALNAAAIQSLKRENDELKSRLEAIEKKLEER